MTGLPLAAPVRWGIIGCGNVTEVKSGPAFQQAEGSALVADPEVDAVYIATPPGSHREHALRVCRAGKPAYVEKPMARNHAECREMVAAFRAGGVPGTGLWDFASDRREDLLEIAGTRARLAVSVYGQEPMQLTLGDLTEEIDLFYPTTVQAPLVQTIVDDLLGRGICPGNGESAARTSRVMDLALESYYGGRTDAFWERPESWPGRR